MRARPEFRRRWVPDANGRLTKQVMQSDTSVNAVMDFTHQCRTDGVGGGIGSKNMKFLANVPLVQWAQWSHDWRMKGGLAGTGMKCQEYVILQTSLPDYAKFVSTPSGKTGFERAARKLAFGYTAHGRNVKVRPMPEPAGDVIRSAAPEPKPATAPLIRSSR